MHIGGSLHNDRLVVIFNAKTQHVVLTFTKVLPNILSKILERANDCLQFCRTELRLKRLNAFNCLAMIRHFAPVLLPPSLAPIEINYTKHQEDDAYTT